jgi:hypothetical protein
MAMNQRTASSWKIFTPRSESCPEKHSDCGRAKMIMPARAGLEKKVLQSLT